MTPQQTVDITIRASVLIKAAAELISPSSEFHCRVAIRDVIDRVKMLAEAVDKLPKG